MQMRFEADIRATSEHVFGILADLRAYDRWLSHSQSFNGTTEISDGPIGVGTTYREPSVVGIRHGKIVEFEPFTRIAFEQPMTSRSPALGVIGIRIDCTLAQRDENVRLTRILELSPIGPVRFALPLLRGPFRRENERVLAALKVEAERA